jgi:predicted enzyme related to lactoylglutathione lyase
MPVVTQHVPGTFCWPELATTDQDAAKAFYMALFDWTARDDAMGEAGTYTILSKDGHEVAALYSLMPDMRAQGVPAHWGAYLSCVDAQASADQATALGGKVVMGPIDVMQHGRMAVVQDPLGAMFCLWQPLSHAGIQLHGEPGSLGWTQLNAKDPERAKAFYTALLGWTYRDDPSPMGTYTTWLKSDGPAGGMMPMPAEAPAPSHWLGYWAVEDVAAAHAKALGLGGRSFVPPTDFGGGTMAVLADPQGAVFALVQFRPA